MINTTIQLLQIAIVMAIIMMMPEVHWKLSRLIGKLLYSLTHFNRRRVDDDANDGKDDDDWKKDTYSRHQIRVIQGKTMEALIQEVNQVLKEEEDFTIAGERVKFMTDADKQLFAVIQYYQEYDYATKEPVVKADKK